MTESYGYAVVIPTSGRSTLVRAIASVINQTIAPSEIIISCAESTVLPKLPSGPIRVVRYPDGGNGNTGRQRGIEAACATTIALLDDDDEWLPEKMRLQLQRPSGQEAVAGAWIVTCRLTPVASDGTQLNPVPHRLPGAGEHLPSYLFRKRTLRGAQGYIQSSTLVFPRNLALAVPFDESLQFHQDIAWLVDVAERFPQLEVDMHPDALVRLHLSHSSVIGRITARGSAEWAKRRLTPISSVLAADFILTQSLAAAARSARPVREQATAVALSFRYGRPTLPPLARAIALITLGFVKHLQGTLKPKGRRK